MKKSKQIEESDNNSKENIKLENKSNKLPKTFTLTKKQAHIALASIGVLLVIIISLLVYLLVFSSASPFKASSSSANQTQTVTYSKDSYLSVCKTDQQAVTSWDGTTPDIKATYVKENSHLSIDAINGTKACNTEDLYNQTGFEHSPVGAIQFATFLVDYSKYDKQNFLNYLSDATSSNIRTSFSNEELMNEQIENDNKTANLDRDFGLVAYSLDVYSNNLATVQLSYAYNPVSTASETGRQACTGFTTTQVNLVWENGDWKYLPNEDYVTKNASLGYIPYYVIGTDTCSTGAGGMKNVQYV